MFGLTVFKLWQGASMGHFCWLDGWLLEKSVKNFLQCDWLTQFMQVILLGLSLVRISSADAELVQVY